MNNNSWLKIVGLLLVITVAAVWVYRTQHRAAPPEPVDLYAGLGTVAGEQVARVLGNKGRVLILTLDPAADPNQVPVLEAFQKTLQQHPGLQVVGTKTFPLAEMRIGDPDLGLTGDRFLKLLAELPEADGVVSFVGVPQFGAIPRFEHPLPKLVIARHGEAGDGLKELLQREVVQSAIVPHPTPPPADAPAPRTPGEWFQQQYRVVTPEQARSLP